MGSAGFRLRGTDEASVATWVEVVSARIGAAVARVDGLVVGVIFVGGAGGLGYVFAGAGAGVDSACRAQRLPRGEIVGAAFALRVGREGTTAVGALGPGDAQPVQVVEHGADEFGLAALRVEVFVAED
jgi:hypothetical protein